MRAKGFLDPYTTMVNIDVSVSATDITSYGILKIDQSAHSLFSEMTITSRGITIERIQEYDLLA